MIPLGGPTTEPPHVPATETLTLSRSSRLWANVLKEVVGPARCTHNSSSLLDIAGLLDGESNGTCDSARREGRNFRHPQVRARYGDTSQLAVWL